MTRGKKLKPRGKLDTIKCDRCRKSKIKCVFSNGPWPVKCISCEKKGVDCPEPTRSQKDPKSGDAEVEAISAGPGGHMGKIRSNLKRANRRRFNFTIKRTSHIIEENKRLKELVAQLRAQIEDVQSKSPNSDYDSGIDDSAAAEIAVNSPQSDHSARIFYSTIPMVHEIMVGMTPPAEEPPKPALLSDIYNKQFKAFRKLLSNLDEEYCIKRFNEGLPSFRFEEQAFCLTLRDRDILILTKSLLDQIQVPPDIITGASLSSDGAQTVRDLICDPELPVNPPFFSVLKALLFDSEKYVLRQLKGKNLPPVLRYFFEDLNSCWVELLRRDTEHRRLSPLEVSHRNSLITAEAYFYEREKEYAKARDAYQRLLGSLVRSGDYGADMTIVQEGVEKVTIKLNDLYRRLQKYTGFPGTIPRVGVPGIYDPVYDKGSETSSECRFSVVAETAVPKKLQGLELQLAVESERAERQVFIPTKRSKLTQRDSDAPSDYSFPTSRSDISMKRWSGMT